jgi:hypothetical protein
MVYTNSVIKDMTSTHDPAALKKISQLYKSNIIYNLAKLREIHTHNYYRVHTSTLANLYIYTVVMHTLD